MLHTSGIQYDGIFKLNIDPFISVPKIVPETSADRMHSDTVLATEAQ